jgi:two-component system, response regulator YesN
VTLDQSMFATIIFLSDNSLKTKKEVCSQIEKLHLTFKSLFNINVVLGIGDVVEDVDSIHSSYIHAKDALKYKLVINDTAYLFYEEIKKRHNDRKEYSYNKEKQILVALKHRQENKIEHYTMNFFNDMRELSIADIELFIAQLLMTIVKELQEIETGDDVYEFQKIYKRAMKCESLDEIEQYVNSLLLQAINTVKSSSLEKKKDLVNKLIQFLIQNYHNPNMSISDLATNVNLSESYIRTQFKEIEGKTINEYLIDLRITKAKELLLNSDHTAKDISEMVGFADNRYFYVVFKKYMGLTTEQFRKDKKLRGE